MDLARLKMGGESALEITMQQFNNHSGLKAVIV